MSQVIARIAQRQQQLLEQGLLRERKLSSITLGSNMLKQEQQTLINFSGNDYLGLSQHKDVINAYISGLTRYGAGSAASPLVTGYSDAHQALEQKLIDVTGFEAALLFCSGFSANNALMKSLFQAGDYLVADKLIHASLIDGILASGARLARFHHNQLDHATFMCKRSPCAAIITESVFSMDGDIAPLQELSTLAKDNHALFIVDDAHGMGVIGEHGFGASQFAVIDILVVTFGKALGGQGAAILASQPVIDFLVSNARHYIYSTALTPAAAAAVTKSIDMIVTKPELRQQLHRNIAYFKRQAKRLKLVFLESETAIQPLFIGDDKRAVKISNALKERGILVVAIRSPTVPKGSARLRITLTANHQLSEIDRLLSALIEVSLDES